MRITFLVAMLVWLTSISGCTYLGLHDGPLGSFPHFAGQFTLSKVPVKEDQRDSDTSQAHYFAVYQATSGEFARHDIFVYSSAEDVAKKLTVVRRNYEEVGSVSGQTMTERNGKMNFQRKKGEAFIVWGCGKWQCVVSSDNLATAEDLANNLQYK